MIGRAVLLANVSSAIFLGVLGAAGAPAAAAVPAAAWKLTVTPIPAIFAPGSVSTYYLVATNVGSAPSSGPIEINATVPAGLKAEKAIGSDNDPATTVNPVCTVSPPTVSCETTESIHPGRIVLATVTVSVPPGPPAEAEAILQASISGGGGGGVSASYPTPIRAERADFGFLVNATGFSAPLNNADGSPAAKAGSHPYQATFDLGFPTQAPGGVLTGAGHLRDLVVDLPQGMVGNPAATPVLCTEAELTSEGHPGCPDASQVGVAVITTALSSQPGVGASLIPSSLYNMVPPPGAVAAFGTDAAEVGIFVHLVASVRTDGDYGASATSNDILALGTTPIFNIQSQLWGDPSGASHDQIRGECNSVGQKFNKNTGEPEPCSVEKQETALLAMPGDCSGKPPVFKAHADSWEEPDVEHEAQYASADLAGNPAPDEGCSELEFEPTFKARPNTDRADSPTGLDVEVHQPQEFDFEGTSTASLKDITVTLPVGLAVNASSGDGLGACTSQQIGMRTAIGETPIHFSKEPAGCPEASKLGTVEVSTPLLAQHDAEHKVLTYPEEGNAIPEVLHGSVYLAKPFDNPFGSLIAVYLTVEDSKTGIIAKFAGEVEPDPITGQLRTRFAENPEQPLEDIRVHLFGGPRAGLQTPPTCTTHTTTAELTPWSTPETPMVPLADSFQTTAAPDGRPCPASEAQLPNSPSFAAGTISPAAGTFSPLLAKLSREDDSQRLTGLEFTAPPGLSAKLAGVVECQESQIAVAQARNAPNEGALEKASPSCPASSEVGVVNVSAGAGPTPLYIQGHAYLAGPYKGAPLSIVTIVPAVAGPFDLGVVVSRAALYLDPTTAQARVVTDPFPTILHGIPVDLRSVAVNVGRPDFTLNPTSCDPMSFAGSATSVLGQVAPLGARFQAGGCKALPYKPKLHLRLFGPIHRGGHPRLRAVFETKPGEANTARIVATLPRSEFIDQAHFRTICTRVQFAAGQCPAGSVYGHVKAVTPLLGYPLEGPVYLRSSSHELPDVVAVLRGPPSQPVEVDAVGRVDSVNGGLRVTFETIPDAPLTKAIFTAQGAKKGLFQNSTNICRGAFLATVKLDGQNGKAHDTRPQVKADCPNASRKKREGRRRH